VAVFLLLAWDGAWRAARPHSFAAMALALALALVLVLVVEDCALLSLTAWW
jgi:hypothetical protein